MGSIKERNIKNRTYYFCNGFIDIETFDSNNLKLDKKSYKDLDIYNIGYVTIKKVGSGYDVNIVNPLYLRINNASGYIEETNEDKYLVFDTTDENKNYLKNIVTFLMKLCVKLEKLMTISLNTEITI